MNIQSNELPEVCKGCWESDCCEQKPELWGCEEETES